MCVILEAPRVIMWRWLSASVVVRRVSSALTCPSNGQPEWNALRKKKFRSCSPCPIRTMPGNKMLYSVKSTKTTVNAAYTAVFIFFWRISSDALETGSWSFLFVEILLHALKMQTNEIVQSPEVEHARRLVREFISAVCILRDHHWSRKNKKPIKFCVQIVFKKLHES